MTSVSLGHPESHRRGGSPRGKSMAHSLSSADTEARLAGSGMWRLLCSPSPHLTRGGGGPRAPGEERMKAIWARAGGLVIAGRFPGAYEPLQGRKEY